MLFVVCCLFLLVANCLRFGVRCLLFAVCFVVRCLLSVGIVCGLFFVVGCCRVLSVVRCVLRVASCVVRCCSLLYVRSLLLFVGLRCLSSVLYGCALIVVVGCCWLFVVCCWLFFVVHCLLSFGVYCLL